MPDPQKVLATIRRAAELSRATPGRIGSAVHLDEKAQDVLVVGDLHGHLHTFRQILLVAALDKNPGRHLVLQELVHDPRIDPDDGIDPSHRLVDLACALKCQYPARVHYLPGNHELSELTGRSIAKGGAYLNAMYRKGVEADYGASTDAIMAAYRDLFLALPLAVRTPNRVFLCHTIPDAQDLDRFDPAVLRSGEWTDEALARGGTVYAMSWGRDTSPETADRFAALVDADLFITGHQPCDDGYLRANHRQLILDGTDPCPAYCLFPANGPATLETLLEGVRPVPMPR